MGQITVIDANGVAQVIAKVANTGSALSVDSLPVVIASDQGTLPVSVSALPLPAGAANTTLQAAILAALGTPAQVGGAVAVSNLPATQPISAVALPLPTGAALSTDVQAVVTALGTLKAGSTAPLATDSAVVVTTSPNSADVADMFIIGQATQTAANNNIMLAAAGTGSVDASGYRSFAIQVVPTGTVSSGVVSFEGSNDQVNYSLIWVSDPATLNSPSFTSISPLTGTTRYLFGNTLFRYVRARISTVIGGGGSIQAFTRFSQPIVAPSVLNALLQANGNILASVAAGSASNGLAVAVTAGASSADYAAQAWAAASGSGSVLQSGFGPVCSFFVNLTAWTVGSSTGLDIFLQWSPDNGTTWFDIWQCEALTGVGSVFIPAIYIPGRRRMRWVNRTGAATLATVSVTAMQMGVGCPTVRQWFDRTANLLNGTATTASAAYDVVGCNTLTATVVLGAVTTTAGTYQIQISHDGTNWSSVGTATIGVANSSVSFSTNNVCARFARVICTIAASGQTGTYVALSGCN